ncbi:MAG: hypothetical protein PHC88_06725 [Terrimicrobiaceae bacterium]|nr:hypothetical protein [Terrimicrobiaceae bacterium]
MKNTGKVLWVQIPGAVLFCLGARAADVYPAAVAGAQASGNSLEIASVLAGLICLMVMWRSRNPGR